MPLFAEIADKMSNVPMMWAQAAALGAFAAVITLPLSIWRSAAGIGLVCLTALLAFGGLYPDLESEIRRELGDGYLFHMRASGFLPLFMSALTCYLVVRKRHNKALEVDVG